MPARWRVGKRVLENAPAFGATISLVVIWNCCFANAFTIDFDLNGGGNNVSRAVEFLASWELEEDREVLQSLLTFRGYERLPTASGPSAQAPVYGRSAISRARLIATATWFW